jgi:hypothetical protein
MDEPVSSPIPQTLSAQEKGGGGGDITGQVNNNEMEFLQFKKKS